MKLRQALVVALAVTMTASLVAAKILWAVTLWYEWIALAVCGACILAMTLLSNGSKSKDGGPSSSIGSDD